MTILNTYVQGNKTYTLVSIPEEDIERHFVDYVSYIELSTNILIEDTLKDQRKEDLQAAMAHGKCVKVMEGDIEHCFAYAQKTTPSVLNIRAMHSYYLDVIPYSRIILLNFLFTQEEKLRYSTLDKWILPNTSILRTESLKYVREGKTNSIRCKRNFWEPAIMQYLNIVELV